LLLLDTTSVRDEKRFAQVKELFLRTLQALPQEMVVQAIFASTPQKLVLPSFMSVGETLTQILFQALKVCPRGGTLREMLEHLPEDAAEETVVILVSSGVSGPLHGIPKIKMPIHLFTIGTVAETPLAELWKKTGWGEHQHFYPGEALSQGTQTANKRLFAYCGKVEVIPQDASVQELLVLNRDLSADGYLDVVCRSHGAPPQEFLLRHHGMDKELLAVAKLSVYSHLPMAVHLFADTKIRGLTRLLSRVDAGSVRAIKKQIEELSLRYDVLSQETMLALHLGKARALVTTQFVLGCGADNRPTVFGEEKRITQISPSVKEECLAMLIEQVRSDGAICELQIAERAERINRTAWAVLALSLEENPSYAAVLKDALAFLAQDTPTGTVGWLYGQRERLAQYLQAHPAEVATILPPLTQIDDVVSAAQMLIKNSLGYAECS